MRSCAPSTAARELPDETVLLIGEEETPSYQEMQQRIGRLRA